MLDASVGRTIARVAESFRKLGIPFHVTGGIVSSFYGVPRYTMDIDFVVLLEGGHRNLPAVVAELGEAFDIDLESARASLRSHGIFQAMDRDTLYKVDFHAGQRVPDELSRSVVEELFPGVCVAIASAEDCVLSKLLWSSMGSNTSWKDAVKVVQRQKGLDFDLMRRLSKQLDLDAELDQLIAEANS